MKIYNNKKWFTLIELFVWIAIMWVVLSFWYNAWYKFYKNVLDKSMAERIKYKINQVITSNDVWRWIEINRIKANNLVFRNNTNIIDNYYYTEVFKVDPVSLIKSPFPTTQFYGMQRVKFPDWIKFTFPTIIEWKQLLSVPSENTQRLIIQRIKPNNKLMVFDWSDNYFQIINSNNMNSFKSDTTFLKWLKELYQWNPIDDNNYYDIKKGSIPTEFQNVEISVYYKKKEIGRIITDSKKRKLIYISHFDDTANIQWLTD